MGEEERLAGGAARADVLEHVEVLREEEEVHDVLWRRAGDLAGELDDRILEAADDGLPLAGDADAGEVLGLGLGLGRLDGGLQSFRLAAEAAFSVGSRPRADEDDKTASLSVGLSARRLSGRLPANLGWETRAQFVSPSALKTRPCDIEGSSDEYGANASLSSMSLA